MSENFGQRRSQAPAVEDGVTFSQRELNSLVRQQMKMKTQERRTAQIERALTFALHKVVHDFILFIQRDETQVYDRHWKRRHPVNQLERLAVVGQIKRGSKYGMTSQNIINRILKSLVIEC